MKIDNHVLTELQVSYCFCKKQEILLGEMWKWINDKAELDYKVYIYKVYVNVEKILGNITDSYTAWW